MSGRCGSDTRCLSFKRLGEYCVQSPARYAKQRTTNPRVSWAQSPQDSGFEALES